MQKMGQIDYEAEVKREDYGLCIEHPVLTNSIPVAHWYLARLRSPFGTPFVWTRQFAKEMPSGHIVDWFDGYYLDDKGERQPMRIFIDSYCSCNCVAPIRGWSVVDEDMNVIESGK